MKAITRLLNGNESIARSQSTILYAGFCVAKAGTKVAQEANISNIKMPTAVAVHTDTESEGTGPVARGRGALCRVARQPVIRELLIFLGFCAMTAVVTWPYVTRMRDAVVDPRAIRTLSRGFFGGTITRLLRVHRAFIS